MTNDAKKSATRIAIIGAGPAGLSTAYFLKKNGYTEVTVLEKLGRIGGLCKSITENYETYDLGANYVTWAYTETLKIAREVGAEMYVEDPYTALIVPEDEVDKTHFGSFGKAVMVDQETGKKIPLFSYICVALKYAWLRYRLGSIIDSPTFAKISQHPELCVPFATWLKENGLLYLTRLFQMPITVMGYNQLDKIATPYALKYMSLKTYIPMLVRGVRVLGRIIRWPKRFILGYQRMWQKVAWGLNVRLNTEITKIARDANGITIYFIQHEQALNRIQKHRAQMKFDHLILACPLSPKVLEREVVSGQKMLDLSREEKELFEKIRTNSYIMYTATVNFEEGRGLPTPIVVTMPLTEVGTPWAVVQQWKEKESFYTQFYVQIIPFPPKENSPPSPDATAQGKRLLPEALDHYTDDFWVRACGETVSPEIASLTAVEARESYRKQAVEAARKLVKRMDGKIEPQSESWQTFDRWPYFQHVTAEEMKSEWYGKLEELQGTQNTYYVGGATNFELVEPIVEYSQNLVNTFFPPDHE